MVKLISMLFILLFAMGCDRSDGENKANWNKNEVAKEQLENIDYSKLTQEEIEQLKKMDPSLLPEGMDLSKLDQVEAQSLCELGYDQRQFQDDFAISEDNPLGKLSELALRKVALAIVKGMDPIKVNQVLYRTFEDFVNSKALYFKKLNHWKKRLSNNKLLLILKENRDFFEINDQDLLALEIFNFVSTRARNKEMRKAMSLSLRIANYLGAYKDKLNLNAEALTKLIDSHKRKEQEEAKAIIEDHSKLCSELEKKMALVHFKSYLLTTLQSVSDLIQDYYFENIVFKKDLSGHIESEYLFSYDPHYEYIKLILRRDPFSQL